MKLSEAIRKGSQLVPQTTHQFFAFDDNGELCGACAFSAAALACGYQPNRSIDWNDSYAAGHILQAIQGCISMDDLLHYVRYNGFEVTLKSAIYDMNDREGKSREEIAHWLEMQGM